MEIYALWEDNIKISQEESGWERVNWIHLTQDVDQWQALVSALICLLLITVLNSCLGSFSILMMEAVSSSEASVDFYRTT